MSPELDHVLVAVTDLEAAARAMEQRNGLASIEGGRHPGWGTANRIVPLGDTYIELIAVVDKGEAAGSPFGRWVAAGATTAGTLLGWAVRTAGLDDAAARLGLVIDAKSRRDASGRLLRWRVAGIAEAAAEPPLPFLIEWGDGTPLPGRAAVTHPRGPVRVVALEVTGDADRLGAWLGGSTPRVTIRAGAPGIAGVVLAAKTGEFALRL